MAGMTDLVQLTAEYSFKTAPGGKVWSVGFLYNMQPGMNNFIISYMDGGNERYALAGYTIRPFCLNAAKVILIDYFNTKHENHETT
jgi:hypothetical protein